MSAGGLHSDSPRRGRRCRRNPRCRSGPCPRAEWERPRVPFPQPGRGVRLLTAPRTLMGLRKTGALNHPGCFPTRFFRIKTRPLLNNLRCDWCSSYFCAVIGHWSYAGTDSYLWMFGFFFGRAPISNTWAREHWGGGGLNKINLKHNNVNNQTIK